MMRIFFQFSFLYLTLSLEPSEKYPHKEILIEPDILTLYWKSNNTYIIFETHFKYSKWLLFGLKSNNLSDVIVSWLNDDQTGHFSDRHIPSNTSGPLLDSKTDWIPLDLLKKDQFTILKFKRTISCTNNQNEDLNIQKGPNKIVFGLGNHTDLLDFNPKVRVIDFLEQIPGPFECEKPRTKIEFTPTEVYTNSDELIPGIYNIFWNYSKDDITGEIHCKNCGWVGFGFSPNGGMDKSDVINFWRTNTGVNFTDRHIQNRSVIIDQNQDWFLLKSIFKDNVTIFKFNRKIVLCDSDDLTIEKGSPYVIFSYGDKPPEEGQDISYHGPGNRGSKKLNFINAPVKPKQNDPVQSETIDFSIQNLILPKSETFYYCQGFRVPDTLKSVKRHIYKYEFLIPEINRDNFHHFLIYECRSDYDGTNPKYINGNCYSNEFKMEYCQAFSIGWAVGGTEKLYFPENTGYPIGGDTDYSFLAFELHYNNPKLDLGFIDKVTLRFHMTKELRKNELGIMVLGADSSPYGISIPPKMEKFVLKTYCLKDCVDKKFKDQGITIVSASPHTHLTGVDVSTRIERNGIDIGYLFRNKYYDFNYQSTYLLEPPVKIQKGDELITQCTYDTSKRNNFTLGGLGTDKEMCLHFLTYYPRRNDFKACLSMPSLNDYKNFFISLNKSRDIKINNLFDPYELNIVTNEIYEQLNESPNKFNLGNKFQNFFYETNIQMVCHEFDPNTYKQLKPKRSVKQPDVCEDKNKH